jgi:hypothetical protein
LPDFFLPVRVLSRRFRRLYLEGIEALYGRGELTLKGRCRELAEPKAWKGLLTTLREKEWVVYAKEPCDSEHVLKYLSRYVYRVAISNHRLIALKDGLVTFRYKDHKRGQRLRTCTLEAVEFLRRLMLHVLPKGLHKGRYFGLMANRHRWLPTLPRPMSHRAPGSNPVMCVQCAVKVACSWSRPIIAIGRSGICPLPCPIWTLHRGE